MNPDLRLLLERLVLANRIMVSLTIDLLPPWKRAELLDLADYVSEAWDVLQGEDAERDVWQRYRLPEDRR